MFLRKLTDEELERIKKSKDDANKVIKAQRKKLQADLKTYVGMKYTSKIKKLSDQLDNLTTITGLPVIVKAEDRSLVMNYDLLKMFDRSLYKSDLRWTLIKIKGDTLAIKYGKHGQGGTVELYELPEHQVRLLTVLPIIDLKE